MKSMDILPANETTEVESRYYLNPQVGLDESTSFIENLRATQQQNNAQIGRDAYNLGTEISSNLGGLGTNTPTGLSYFTSRMQTPQTASAVANLRATAQAAALSQALQNEQEIWKNRYQQAYRNYQKSAYNKSNQASTTGGTGGTTAGEVEVVGDVDTTSTASTIEIDPLTGRAGYYSVVDPYTGIVTDVSMETGEASQRGLTYTDVPITQMRNEKYTNEEGKNTWGWTFSLPSGTKVGIKYPSQKIVRGSDGNYYKYENGTYSYLGR